MDSSLNQKPPRCVTLTGCVSLQGIGDKTIDVTLHFDVRGVKQGPPVANPVKLHVAYDSNSELSQTRVNKSKYLTC